MKHRDIAGALGSAGRRFGATAALACTLAATAGASELKMPKAHPQVAFDVPDDWSVERSSFAVEIRSPEKNSIVVASVLPGGKSTLDGWTKQAGEKLKAFGVLFDANAKAPPKPPEPAGSTKPPEVAQPARSPQAVQEEKAAADAKSAFTTSPDAFTFSGAPSLKVPGTEGSNRPVKPADNSIETLSSLGPGVPSAVAAEAAKPKLPFKAVQIYGSTMNGKSVDVQLLIYPLPANHLFVMMQESGSDDGRAVAMAQSVRKAE